MLPKPTSQPKTRTFSYSGFYHLSMFHQCPNSYGTIKTPLHTNPDPNPTRNCAPTISLSHFRAQVFFARPPSPSDRFGVPRRGAGMIDIFTGKKLEEMCPDQGGKGTFLNRAEVGGEGSGNGYLCQTRIPPLTTPTEGGGGSYRPTESY